MVTGVSLEGKQGTDHLLDANFNTVSANYFDVMGIGVSQGRTFTAAEMNRRDALAIVSEAMARTYWHGQDPLGKLFLYGAGGASMLRVQIVGVAKDVRSVHISEPDGPVFYLPVNPNKPLDLGVVTRANSKDVRLIATIRRLVREIDPNVLASVGTMEENLEHETSPAPRGDGSRFVAGRSGTRTFLQWLFSA